MDLKRLIPLVILIVLLGQSCTVYRDTPSGVNDVIGHKKVKAVNNLGNELILNKIHFENGTYYANYNLEKIKLDTSQIRSYYLKDIEKSKKKTKKALLISGIVVVGIPVIIITSMAICFSAGPCQW